MNTVTQLKKARAFVANGWVQGDYVAKVGRTNCFCAIGAVARAQSSNAQEVNKGIYDVNSTHPAVKYLLKALSRKTHRKKVDYPTTGSITDWNDTKGRTKEQVLDLFDRAIALAEKDSVSA